MKVKDETDKKYGTLTVISRAEPDGKGVAWICKCDCGRIRRATGTLLRYGRLKNCGYKPCRGEAPAMENGKSAKNNAYRTYKGNAERRGILFTLTVEEFMIIASLPCYYCGNPPSNVRKSGSKKGEDFTYQGIDRENNSQGYTRSNSVPCCITCNKAKGVMSHTEFLDIITRIYLYSIAS